MQIGKDFGRGYEAFLTTGQRSCHINFQFGYDYFSPHGIIVGHKRKSETDYTYDDGQGYCQQRQQGEPYLELHVELPRDLNPTKKRSDLVSYLDRGLSDLLSLMQTLEKNRKFRGVNILSGSTHRSLANFALNKLGFHPETELNALLAKQNDMPELGDDVYVFMSKQELLQQRARIAELHQHCKDIALR